MQSFNIFIKVWAGVSLLGVAVPFILGGIAVVKDTEWRAGQ